MSLEPWVSIVAAVLAAAAALAALRLHPALSKLSATVERGQQENQRALRELERYVDVKLERLPSALRTEPRGESELGALVAALTQLGRAPEVADHPATGRRLRPWQGEKGDVLRATEPEGEDYPAEEASPIPVHLSSAGEDEERKQARLRLALDSPDFRQNVWPHLDGAFEVSRSRVLDYLVREGVEPPRITAHPPASPQTDNHWLFLVIQGQNEGGGRFLVPRTFSRYDPAVHDHLFELPGRARSIDNYVRECPRLAILEPQGELQTFIDRRLVKRKGEIRV